MRRFWVYYYGSLKGPFSLGELPERAPLTAETLVCPEEHSGFSAWHWKPANAFPELIPLLAPGTDGAAPAPAPDPAEAAAARSGLSATAPGAAEAPAAAAEAPAADAPSGETTAIDSFLATDELPSLGGSIDEERIEVPSPQQWALVGLSLLVSTIYLTWRWKYTLNYTDTASTAISMGLWFAEAFGVFSAVLYFAQVFRCRYRGPASIPSTDALPTVDVYVAIYDEPVEILYKTLVGCKAIDYPSGKIKVYVLDDGRREEVERVAKSLDCLYLTRDTNEGAKAGNINAALPRTTGEVLLLLDCDHIPVESILTETVGFFVDSKVAWVQLPHHFYNPDCYQKNLHLEGEIEHEQDLFFRVLMPGRDSANAAIFAGSSTLMRREALEEIGGCRTECAIEDMHTGMELHSRGWKSVFYPKTLSAGLSPESFRGLLTQRARWTRGGVQLFFKENPLFKSGLSIAQRFHYFSSVLYFLNAVPRMIFVLAPLGFLIFGTSPILAETWKIAAYFLPHYVLSYLAFSVMSKGYRNPFWSDAYEVATVFSLFSTILQTMLRPDKLIFNVTPKGESTETRHERLDWSFVMPHIVMLGLLLIGVVIAVIRFAAGTNPFDACALSGFWAVINVLLLGAAIEVARERPQQRDSYRLRRPFKVEVHSRGKVYPGVSSDLSESGAGLVLDMKAHVDVNLTVVFLGDKERTELPAAVMRKEWTADGKTRLGIRFTEMGVAARRSLLRQLYTRPGGWDREPPEVQPMLEALAQIASSSVRPRVRRVHARPRRAWPRVHADLPCTIKAGGASVSAHTVDLSCTGAAIRVPHLTAVPEEGEFILVGADGREYHFDAKVIRIPVRSGAGLRFWQNAPQQENDIYGIRFIKPEFLDLAKAAKPFLDKSAVATH